MTVTIIKCFNYLKNYIAALKYNNLNQKTGCKKSTRRLTGAQYDCYDSLLAYFYINRIYPFFTLFYIVGDVIVFTDIVDKA